MGCRACGHALTHCDGGGGGGARAVAQTGWRAQSRRAVVVVTPNAYLDGGAAPTAVAANVTQLRAALLAVAAVPVFVVPAAELAVYQVRAAPPCVLAFACGNVCVNVCVCV